MAGGYQFPVDLTTVMLFARALGDVRPEYSDPEAEETKAVGGVVVPPTFMQAGAHWDPEFPLDLTRPGRETKAAAGEGEQGGLEGTSLGRGLHAEQRFEYHHVVHAGDTLTASTRPGNRWEKVGRRAGTLKFSETVTEFRNQDGVLCVTATQVGVQTERPAEQA